MKKWSLAAAAVLSMFAAACDAGIAAGGASSDAPTEGVTDAMIAAADGTNG